MTTELPLILALTFTVGYWLFPATITVALFGGAIILFMKSLHDRTPYGIGGLFDFILSLFFVTLTGLVWLTYFILNHFFPSIL
jgi:hypothetical protein